MDTTRFDAIARLLAGHRSRRQAMVQAGAGLAASALAAAGLAAATRDRAAAQDATPPASAAGEKTTFLFLQAFQSGRIEPKAGAEGTYTLTLEQGLGQTIYFSDRPERIVGASPTPQFLEGLGFPADNPPNAALVVETAGGETEIAVVELFTPAYDDASHTATYEVAVLAEWENALGVGLTQTPADLAAFGPEFGAAHLFIDDCPDLTNCYAHNTNQYVGLLPGGPTGQCWSWDTWCCSPYQCNNGGHTTDYYDSLCNRNYHDSCPAASGGCYAK